jgi:hypothetical protein
MLRMCVCMHSCFIENHPIQIIGDGPLISEVVLSQPFLPMEVLCGLSGFVEMLVKLRPGRAIRGSEEYWMGRRMSDLDCKFGAPKW